MEVEGGMESITTKERNDIRGDLDQTTNARSGNPQNAK